MKKQVNIKIDPELLKEAQDFAKAERRSFTSFVEIALQERIERAKKSNKK